MDNFNSIIQHLEFLGYKIGIKELSGLDKEKHIREKHFFAEAINMRNSFLVTYKPGNGFNFLASFIAKSYAKNNKLELLELLNKINSISCLSSFVATENLEKVFLLAWYPDNYSKASFGTFLDIIDNDIKYAISHVPQILKFIE
jgi:hypothetical protein